MQEISRRTKNVALQKILCYASIQHIRNPPIGERIMNKEIFSTFTEETKKALAPVEAFNRLVIDNAEKLVALQIASIQSYYALSFTNLKALLEVHDAEAFKAYVGKHNEFVKSVSEQVAGDAKAVAELGKDFTEEVKKIGEESVKAVTEKAA